MGVPFIEKPDGKLTTDSGELPALLDDDNESEDGDEFNDTDDDDDVEDDEDDEDDEDEIDEDDHEIDEEDDESDGEDDDIRQHGELGYAYSTDETEEEWEDPSENGVLSCVLDASERGDETELQVLLPELNVSVNTPNSDGDTALHLAALYGHTGCARLLLGAGARADIRDENEGVPLHDAAAGGYHDLVQLLLDSAPHCINARDVDGDTPLHNAARGGFADIIRFLLERGADPGAQNNESMTPLDLTVAGSAARNALMNR
jgi:ankyrin repeat protein